MSSEDPEVSGSPPVPGGGDITPPEAGKSPAEASQRDSVRLHHRYYQLLQRSRLMVVAFWAAMGYFIFWAVPWFPGGLNEKDYTERVAFTFVLGGTCGFLGISTLIVREYLRRTRESLLAWRAVYDDTTGLYNRQYFYDRLALECERARRQGTTFSLIVMRFEHRAGRGRRPDADSLRRLSTALGRTARANDLAAVLGGNELAVAAIGVSRKMLPQVRERFETALEASLADSGEQLQLRLGSATYGARCRHPSTLLRLARAAPNDKSSLEGREEKGEQAA